MTDLKFDGVSKRYLVRNEEDGPQRGGLLGKLDRWRAKPREFWAVKDVSFDVQRGEALGIIGHNGAGKSTILKLLSNITTPTRGQITINGRLASLIEVGSGFHPDLTGRENVFLNGAILGMRRREIAQRFESIVEFAEIRQFIDTPVKRYSSGMYVRLGFSIAAHLNPDILLLDEVLAVGDAAFQEKCARRFLELKQAGTTLVFISHDLVAVERLCDRVLLMKRGQLVASGPPAEVIREYQEHGGFVQSGAPRTQSVDITKKAEVKSLAFYDAVGRKTTAFFTGHGMTARVDYQVNQELPDSYVCIQFFTQDNHCACQFTTELSGGQFDLRPGEYTIEFSCDELGLQPGLYNVDVAIEQHGTQEVFDWHSQCATIHVELGRKVRGRFYMPQHWRMVRELPSGTGQPEPSGAAIRRA